MIRLPRLAGWLAGLALAFVAFVAFAESAPAPATVVILGATGDLAGRMLVPALSELEHGGLFPAGSRVVGFALPTPELAAAGPDLDEGFRRQMTSTLERVAKGKLPAGAWEAMQSRVSFAAGNLTDPASFTALKAKLDAQDAEDRAAGKLVGSRTRIFYLAIPPQLIGAAVTNLHAAGLAGKSTPGADSRVVVEKPIGIDHASATKINDVLEAEIGEAHTYRMDHYLGKDNVRGLRALRFDDPRLKALWNKRYVKRIEVRAEERLGVEGRGAFYDSVGATRDMIHSHLLQTLALTLMDRPRTSSADDFREAKTRVLGSLRPIGDADAGRSVIRGQYAASADGKIKAYRDEPGVRPDSSTETFTAMRVHADMRAWKNVPIDIVTGKGLAAKSTEVRLHLRRLPVDLAASLGRSPDQPALLTVGIDPQPSLKLDDQPLALERSADHALSPYARQLRDVLRGDQSMFLHRRDSEVAWRFVDPIEAAWKRAGARGLATYKAGSRGPARAHKLLGPPQANTRTAR